MGDWMNLNPTWRSGKPFLLVRNPSGRDRLNLLRDSDRRSLRFVLSGKGELFVGNAWEFLHHDSHTALTSLYGANSAWDGEIIFQGPHFPISFDGILNPAIDEDSPLNKWYARPPDRTRPRTGAEYSDDGAICLARMSNYHYRGRGLLDHSRAWSRFTSVARLPAIPPLADLIANQPCDGATRALMILHGDGHLYFFPHDMPLLEADRLLGVADRALYPRHGDAEVGEVLAMRLGGNGNSEVLFSEVSHPLEFLRDNQNYHRCFRAHDPEIIESKHVATPRHSGIARENLPQWSNADAQ